MRTKVSESRSSRQNPGAFTLIELMVVVATLAVLAALLVPVLAGSKAGRISFQCLENQKRLAQGLILYAGDNSDNIVPMATLPGGVYLNYAGGFWGGPTGPSIPNSTPDVMLAAARGQAMTNNPLAPYVQNTDVYVCAGDSRIRKTSKSAGWAYGSYSKTQNVGGEPYSSFFGAGATYTNASAISAPSRTVCFMEAASAGSSGGGTSAGYNRGTWAVTWNRSLGTFNWLEPLGLFHGDISTAAFTDGHAEFHKWTSASLIDAGMKAAAGPAYSMTAVSATAADKEFIHDGYRFPGWK